MKNKKVLSKAIIVFLTVFTIMICSTTVFALSYSQDSEIPEGVTISQADNTNMQIQTLRTSIKKSKASTRKVIAVAVVVSVVGTGVIVFFVWKSYKTNGMTEPYPYDDKAPLQLSESNDLLFDTKVTKRKIEKNG